MQVTIRVFKSSTLNDRVEGHLLDFITCESFVFVPLIASDPDLSSTPFELSSFHTNFTSISYITLYYSTSTILYTISKLVKSRSQHVFTRYQPHSNFPKCLNARSSYIDISSQFSRGQFDLRTNQVYSRERWTWTRLDSFDCPPWSQGRQRSMHEVWHIWTPFISMRPILNFSRAGHRLAPYN